MMAWFNICCPYPAFRMGRANYLRGIGILPEATQGSWWEYFKCQFPKIFLEIWAKRWQMAPRTSLNLPKRPRGKPHKGPLVNLMYLIFKKSILTVVFVKSIHPQNRRRVLYDTLLWKRFRVNWLWRNDFWNTFWGWWFTTQNDLYRGCWIFTGDVQCFGQVGSRGAGGVQPRHDTG